jgi:hypothetical protein
MDGEPRVAVRPEIDDGGAWARGARGPDATCPGSSIPLARAPTRRLARIGAAPAARPVGRARADEKQETRDPGAPCVVVRPRSTTAPRGRAAQREPRTRPARSSSIPTSRAHATSDSKKGAASSRPSWSGPRSTTTQRGRAERGPGRARVPLLDPDRTHARASRDERRELREWARRRSPAGILGASRGPRRAARRCLQESLSRPRSARDRPRQRTRGSRRGRVCRRASC